MDEKLSAYRRKRDFKKTKEPKGAKKAVSKKPIFVIQKHAASHLHYDFRLEMKDVLKSWAVPKGPPKTKGIKRLAILTEDHPMEYAKFEGIIPEGEYGAGTVEIWDSGTFENLKPISLEKSFKEGKIEINLQGKKLKGGYALIRFRDKKSWLLIKMSGEKK